jgi:hypothetical protein
VMRDNHAHSFGTLTTTFYFWPNLVRGSSATWETRFNDLWMMPPFFKEGSAFAEQHHWVPDYVSGALADDLNQRRPDIVFVENGEIADDDGLYVNLAAYFNSFPRFRSAFSHYHRIDTIYSCSHPEKTPCGYDVYLRASGEGGT